MKQLENLDESEIIFYDIETSRGVKVLEEGTPLYDAWLYKARYNNELDKKTGLTFTPEEYFYEKAPLYAPFGRVVTVVVGRIKDNKIHLKSYASYDEKQLLEDFNRDLNLVYNNNTKVRFCSFNGVKFDTPYLEKRMIVNGIKPSALLSEGHLEPWKVTQIDLAKIWQGNAFYPDSLVAVATVLGLPSPKDALDGSQVSEAFYSGRLPEIVTYCLKDVETTARIYRKLTFLPDLDAEVVILDKAVVDDKKHILERINNSPSITEEQREELVKLLSKKKIAKKDLPLIKEILTKVYGCYEMFKNDSPAVLKRKEEEIDEILKQFA